MTAVNALTDRFWYQGQVLTRSLQVLTGPYILKLKMTISRLGSKISKNVPGISRVIHRDASIAKFFFVYKKTHWIEDISLKWSHGVLSMIFGFLTKFWVGIYIFERKVFFSKWKINHKKLTTKFGDFFDVLKLVMNI